MSETSPKAWDRLPHTIVIADLWFESVPDNCDDLDTDADVLLAVEAPFPPDWFVVHLVAGLMEFWRVADIRGCRVFSTRPPKPKPFNDTPDPALVSTRGPMLARVRGPLIGNLGLRRGVVA